MTSNPAEFLLVGQLSTAEHSLFSMFVDSARKAWIKRCQVLGVSEEFPSYEAFQEADPVLHPENQKANSVRYLELLAERFGVRNAYRAAFANLKGVPPDALPAGSFGSWGSIVDHINAANKALANGP